MAYGSLLAKLTTYSQTAHVRSANVPSGYSPREQFSNREALRKYVIDIVLFDIFHLAKGRSLLKPTG